MANDSKVLSSLHFDTKYDNNQFILDTCIFKVNNYHDYYEIKHKQKRVIIINVFIKMVIDNTFKNLGYSA